MRELKFRADHGEVTCQQALGLIFELGFDTNFGIRPFDAFRYWFMAAKRGDPWGQLTIARFLIEGFGANQDHAEADLWLERAEGQGYPAPRTRSRLNACPPKAKVLLVDDSPTVLRVIRYDLEAAGYQVLTAASGRQALEILSEHQAIRAIVSDVNMPEMDGIAFAEAVQAQGLNRRLGMIMLTSESDKNLVLRGKKAGIHGWLVKPPEPETLLNLVEAVIAKKA